MNERKLIEIKNCILKKNNSICMNRVDFEFKTGEAYLITGPNGGGKADFVNALAGKVEISAERKDSVYESVLKEKVCIVSLEEAAALIQEERDRDESEYMDKQDIGRTGRAYICEVLGGSSRKNAPLPEIASRLETLPEVKLCGVEKILDRGLHFMSTGEIRRLLLCRALLSGAKLLILSDPFAGLDKESRKILLDFFDTIVKRQLSQESDSSSFPRIILCMERFTEIPVSINRVIEFKKNEVSFCGTKDQYAELLDKRIAENEKSRQQRKEDFLNSIEEIRRESKVLTDGFDAAFGDETLVKFEDVNVGYDDHKVLVNLNWEIKKGEHHLVRGPNGSGKTTIMELITGDNMQVFREKIYIFGKRRGTGESIWDIKKKLGIVSYRLHVEYRMVGGTELENVIISGFKDSIGLYEVPSDFEKAMARAWLKLAGFEGREHETFGSLSYGEQRAILIVRAAVKSPALLILDEPCHGLDQNFREKVLDLLETVASTGTTTLLHVTHDPTEVLECEKNILELNPGQDPMFKIIRK